MTTPQLILGLIGGCIILGIFIWMGVMLHMAHTQESQLIEYFKRSEIKTPMKNSGIIGRLMFVSSAAFLVTFPNACLKQGRLNAEDLRNCPSSLRRKLVILELTVIGLLSSAILLWCVGKLAGY